MLRCSTSFSVSIDTAWLTSVLFTYFTICFFFSPERRATRLTPAHEDDFHTGGPATLPTWLTTGAAAADDAFRDAAAFSTTTASTKVQAPHFRVLAAIATLAL
jgi:hypothetical protein